MFHACICTSSLKFLYLQLAETTCMQPYYYCIEAVLQTGLFALSGHCDEISLSRALDRRDHGRITLVLLNKTPQPFPCNLQTQNSSPQTSTITHRTTTLQYSFISPPRQTHVTYVAFNVLDDPIKSVSLRRGDGPTGGTMLFSFQEPIWPIDWKRPFQMMAGWHEPCTVVPL